MSESGTSSRRRARATDFSRRYRAASPFAADGEVARQWLSHLAAVPSVRPERVQRAAARVNDAAFDLDASFAAALRVLIREERL